MFFLSIGLESSKASQLLGIWLLTRRNYVKHTRPLLHAHRILSPAEEGPVVDLGFWGVGEDAHGPVDVIFALVDGAEVRGRVEPPSNEDAWRVSCFHFG